MLISGNYLASMLHMESDTDILLDMTATRDYSNLWILLFSSLVIITSIALLFIYVNGLFGRQTEMEDIYQADLTEESAVHGLQHDIETGSISDFSLIPSYMIDDQSTSFTVLESSSVPPEEVKWSTGGRILDFQPVDSRVFVISEPNDGGLGVDLFDPLDGSEERVLSLDKWEADEFRSAATVCDQGPLLFLLYRTGENVNVLAVTPGYPHYIYAADFPFPPNDAVLSAGILHGTPALLVSDGYNVATLFETGTGASFRVVSPPGTAPVFLGRNRLLGDINGSVPLPDDLRVLDIFKADFDHDGLDDYAFAGPGSLALYSSSIGSVFVDSVEDFRLTAWGTAEDSGRLSGRWVRGSGDSWRIFMNGAFVDAPGPELLPYDWEGRLFYARHSILGTVDGEIVTAREWDGRKTVISAAGRNFICRLDESGEDLMEMNQDTLTILLDPLMGNGLSMMLSSSTVGPGDEMLKESQWKVTVYGFGMKKRVILERLG